MDDAFIVCGVLHMGWVINIIDASIATGWMTCDSDETTGHNDDALNIAYYEYECCAQHVTMLTRNISWQYPSNAMNERLHLATHNIY